MTRAEAKIIAMRSLPQYAAFTGDLFTVALYCSQTKDLFKYEGEVYEAVKQLVSVNIVIAKRRLDLCPAHYDLDLELLRGKFRMVGRMLHQDYFDRHIIEQVYDTR